MKYLIAQITFQEVPDEVSLCFLIAGCPLRCPGCHSADSWKANQGEELTKLALKVLLKKYESVITCVCFLGGEWFEEELVELCRWVRTQNLKTCLYTGLEDVSTSLKQSLDFLKVGPYRKEKGGLSSPATNQKFIDLRTGEVRNHVFNEQGGYNGSAQRVPDRPKNSFRA